MSVPFFIYDLDVVRLISEFVKFSYLFRVFSLRQSLNVEDAAPKFDNVSSELQAATSSCEKNFEQIFEAVKFSGAAASA